MGTHEPEKLWSLWATEQIDIEMAMGYDLQNAVKLYKTQIANNATLRQLQGRIDTLEAKTKTQQTKIDRLQTLVDSLIAHTGMKPNPKGKKKPSQKG
jgi:hypothetical protein